jgi:starch phosphorylase
MRNQYMSKREFKEEFTRLLRNRFRKEFDEATEQEKYQVFAELVKDDVIDRWIATQNTMNKSDPKIVYYMSMEFLVGRALGNNMLNIGTYDKAKEYLAEIGIDINAIEDQEPDPALGNGGLGRLAACFMDSLSTLGYAAYGCGIRYRYGMFKQKIEDGYQKEVTDDWLKNPYPFELKRDEYHYEVKFGGYVRTEQQPDGRIKFIQDGYHSIIAVPYDMPITGYKNNVVNTLMMWDAEPKEVFSLDSFDKGEYEKAVEEQNLARNLVEVLYPNDNHVSGKELRLRQQYFFVSASIQRALDHFKKNHSDIHDLPKKVTFQMNDTHPTLAVAELMRILVDEEGLEWEDAWDITTHTCAYTNHTIMQEALEKWPIEIFSRLLPRIYQIVEEINRRFTNEIRQKFPGDEERVNRMAIVHDGQVRMAYLAIIGGYSVNGVAKAPYRDPEKGDSQGFLRYVS